MSTIIIFLFLLIIVFLFEVLYYRNYFLKWLLCNSIKFSNLIMQREFRIIIYTYMSIGTYLKYIKQPSKLYLANFVCTFISTIILEKIFTFFMRSIGKTLLISGKSHRVDIRPMKFSNKNKKKLPKLINIDFVNAGKFAKKKKWKSLTGTTHIMFVKRAIECVIGKKPTRATIEEIKALNKGSTIIIKNNNGENDIVYYMTITRTKNMKNIELACQSFNPFPSKKKIDEIWKKIPYYKIDIFL